MNKEKIISVLDKIIEWAFYILIAGVTFSNSFSDGPVAVIIIGYLLKKIIKKDATFPRTSFLIAFAAFVAWNAISIFNSGYLYESLRGLLKVVKYGLLLTATIDVFKEERPLKKAVSFLMLWSIVVATNGIIQDWLGFDILRFNVVDTLDYLPRISSSFPQANDFGTYLVLVIPVFLVFTFSKKINLRHRAYFLLGLLFLLYCIMRTYSRGAWLALLAATLMASFLKSRKLFVVLIIVVVIGSLFLPQQVKARVMDIFNLNEGTSWQRLKLWSGAVNMIKQHPVIGFGVNTYTKNFAKYKPADYPDVIYSHNCYLQMATEIGIAGLLLFLLFIIMIFIYVIKRLKGMPHGWIRNSIIGLISGGAGFLVHSGVDTSLYSIKLTLTFYLFLGLCAALSKYAKTNPAG